MNAQKNIILNTDSYKASHWLQYPPGTEYVFSYIESRGGKWDEAVYLGMQAYLREYLSVPITKAMIDYAEKIWTAHGEPFNREGWEYILYEHKGKLPLEIRGAPEGMVIPNRNIMASVINTDPKCYWLVSYIETSLLRAIWYATTVATQSREIKKIIAKYLDETGTPEGISFKLHDFGARGVSSFESATLGGLAHLVNFMGTDTMSGILGAMEYYDAKEMPAFSIPAAEHSTMTSWGGREGEVDAMRNMIKQFGGKYPLIAVVSDSYNIYDAARTWGTVLKQDILDSGSTIVVRPDSGHPATVVLEVLEILDETVGTTVNNKGYKVLPNWIRVIQGDGINIDSIKEILSTLKANNYSADNIAFGMGGALLQQINRDTLKFAMKASAIRVNGEWVDVFKDPITDSGKSSKKGRIMLYQDRTTGELITRRFEEEKDLVNLKPMLDIVYLNGELKNQISFDEVRNNAKL